MRIPFFVALREILKSSLNQTFINISPKICLMYILLRPEIKINKQKQLKNTTSYQTAIQFLPVMPAFNPQPRRGC